MRAPIHKLKAMLAAPKNKLLYWGARRRRDQLLRRTESQASRNRRILDYDRALLPNKYLAAVEAEIADLDAARSKTGETVGYPSWNLLYYALLCSLPGGEREVVVVETGTNLGFSSIIMAQVLKDRSCRGKVRTVDIDADVVGRARENIARAGLSDHVEFHVGDSLDFLSRLVSEVEYIDFAFLDGSHKFRHVVKEFAIIYPRVVACRGKVYFDNTTGKGLSRALDYIRRAYGGNAVHFTNCSWSRPGNALWQPF